MASRRRSPTPPQALACIPALLEAAAALTRLAQAAQKGEVPSPDEVGAVCAVVLAPLRPEGAEGAIEVATEGDYGLVKVSGASVPMAVPAGLRGRTWKHVYSPIPDAPPGDVRRGWHVLETCNFKRGEVRVNLDRPYRAATPEEIARQNPAPGATEAPEAGADQGASAEAA